MAKLAKFVIKKCLQPQRQHLAISRSIYNSFGSGSSQGATNGARYASRRARQLFVVVGGSAISLAALILMRSFSNRAEALSLKKRMAKQEMDIENIKLTARERRFIKFASVEFGDQLYMTPQDFLDSVVEQEPRPRLKRRVLNNEEVEKYKEQTPALKKGSTRLFRNLRDKGIISYTEYLFLLSILTKPRSGFRIAFNMFDTDGNQRVDRDEFLVMERIFSGAWKEKHGEQEAEVESENNDNTESHYVDDKEGLQRRQSVATTLQLHFFGKRGTGVINYDNFYRFMDNLQTEVLELEFHEFSKGNSVISELDFAKILLRYTYLATDEYDVFLERLLSRIKDDKGISFNDFRDFCHFLNNLDDFTIAMRMYTLADRAISKDEFSRAVKICTGYNLSPHLIETVFAIFDEDGDGLLSYKEFIAIMKDRLHRGFKQDALIIEQRKLAPTAKPKSADEVCELEMDKGPFIFLNRARSFLFKITLLIGNTP
ncbi:calcium uptake protein 3, mitochondrial isoform X6 [Scaptodrosophila lebanonensis]|uniref:Calcium uptake protein 3, mitochondrial isoform X6 n=1 Tax=Drosophila lebanonensis TaxID=7225 RepID=A0A6J2T9B6_DROLE|nr:calcium uptake protein 3, mitochondrial isoform X6 [Scaptodrosophila lebanonensis]